MGYLLKSKEVVVNDPALIREVEKALEKLHLDTIEQANNEIKQILREQLQRNTGND